VSDEQKPADLEPRPWHEIRESGLLWLINSAVFHPRGFALSVHIDKTTGVCTGWNLIGDGTEPWRFEGDIDSLFEAAENTFFEACRRAIGDDLSGSN
jgi:hypothetical protein